MSVKSGEAYLPPDGPELWAWRAVLMPNGFWIRQPDMLEGRCRTDLIKLKGVE